MAVPKRRKSSSKRDMRRAQHDKVVPNVIPCPNCSAPMISHRVCPSCGQYKGQVVMPAKATEK